MTRPRREQYKDEILQRSSNGESGEEIAAALRQKGVDVSYKTINRWRLSWGIRRRPASATAGRKFPDRKQRLPKPRRGSDGTVSNEFILKAHWQSERKADITRRTLRGESAEQILNALKSQGIHFKKGLSTIWRLQTRWGLIPMDVDEDDELNSARRGQQSATPAGHDADDADDAEGADLSAMETTQQQTRSLRKRRQVVYTPAPGSRPQSEGEEDYSMTSASASTSPDDSELDTSAGSTGMLQRVQVASPSPSGQASGHVAAELISAELLVDMATSSVAWANHLRELFLARIESRAISGSQEASPPTDDDVANAKRKLIQTITAMLSLALPSGDKAEVPD